MKIHNIECTDKEAQEFASYMTAQRIEKRIWPQFHKAIAVEWLYQKREGGKMGMTPFITEIIGRQLEVQRKIKQLERDLRHIEGLLKDSKCEDFLGVDLRACLQRARMLKMRQIDKIKESNEIY